MQHESPEWVRAGADYFITVCAAPRGLNHFCNAKIGPAVLDSITYRHENHIWFCDLAVLMPDHIHLIVSFPDVPSLAKIVGDWKRWLNVKHAITWQENFFDHRIRNETDRSKGEYILQNPVRAGLVTHAKDWPWVWTPR
jgi:REP element-mobilizing transposase RayT